MNSTDDAGMSSESITLLLSISAVQRLADPSDAITDARSWTEQVGIVGDGGEPVDDVEGFVDELEASPDFVAGPSAGSLASIRQRVHTERHVVIGTSERHQEIAAALGWEYLPVAEAAGAAEWELTVEKSR